MPEDIFDEVEKTLLTHVLPKSMYNNEYHEELKHKMLARIWKLVQIISKNSKPVIHKILKNITLKTENEVNCRLAVEL